MPSDTNYDQGKHDNYHETAQRHVERRSQALEQIGRAKTFVSNFRFRSAVVVGLLDSEQFNDAFFEAQVIEKFAKSDSLELPEEEAKPVSVADLPHADEDEELHGVDDGPHRL